MSSFVAEITIGNNTFQVLEADISYFQQTRGGGMPSSGIQGGTFSVKLESSSGSQYDKLSEWMFEKSLMQKGLLRFYKKDGISKLFDFEFYDAHCIRYQEYFNSSESLPMITTLTISPGITRIRNLVKERPWKVSELTETPVLPPHILEVQKHFITFLVVDDTGQPLENIELQILLPGGALKVETTKGDGMIKIENIRPGRCKILSDWRKVSKIDDSVLLSE